jgi:DNA primase
MEKAPILIDVLIQEQIPETIPENITMKIDILQRVFALLSPLKENLAATERIMSVTKTLRFGSDPATILHDYKEYLSRHKERQPMMNEKPKLEEVETHLQTEALTIEHSKPSSLQESGPMTKAEKVFLREIICHPEFLTQLNGDEFLAYIGHHEVKKLFQWLVKIYFEIDEAEYVRIVQDELAEGNYSKEIRDVSTDALFNYGNKLNEKVIQRMLNDYKRNLKRDQLTHKKRELEEQQKVAKTEIEVNHLLSEIYKIAVEISKL